MRDYRRGQRSRRGRSDSGYSADAWADPPSLPIYLAADTLKSCSSFDASIKQAINLVTDGEPNRCCNYDSDLYAPDNECPPGTDFYDSVVAARDYLIATLQMTDGQDEIDIEGIGLTEANLDWLMDSIAWPEPGYIAPPFTAGPGWVRQIASFQEFADTISEKFEIVLSGSITAHKFNDLNGDGEQDTGEVNLEGWTMTLYEGSECTGDPLDSGTTGSDGNVVFTDLEAGIYFVKETLESGWTNTTPLCQQTIITTGDHTTLYFGNFEIPPTPGIYIEKTADPNTVSEADTVITYSYKVTNNGEGDLTGIEVTDDKLGDIPLAKTTLDPGETTSGTASYNVTQRDIDEGEDIVNVATVTCHQQVTHNDTATVTITSRPAPRGVGGGSCPSRKYLTVDWEGNNTTKPLYSNNKLAVDLLGPSSDVSHSLLLDRGTHAPVVGGYTYYLITIRELEEIPDLPENTEAIVVFNITPSGAVFNRDIFLTLGLDESQLPENALNVTMAYYDDINAAWVLLASEAGGPSGVAELTLSAPINHFSIFGVLAELAPTGTTQSAHFVSAGLNIEPSEEQIWKPIPFITKTGESVTITANVANEGGQEGLHTVVLNLNGEPIDSDIITVPAGRSREVSFTLSGLDSGHYEVEVAGHSGEFTVSQHINWWLIIGIVVAVGLIIWGAIWSRRKSRKATQGA